MRSSVVGLAVALFVTTSSAHANNLAMTQGGQFAGHSATKGSASTELQRLQSEIDALERRVAALEKAIHTTTGPGIPPGLGGALSNNSGLQSAAGGNGLQSAAGANGMQSEAGQQNIGANGLQSAAMVHRKHKPKAAPWGPRPAGARN
jgi:hypothetical protein